MSSQMTRLKGLCPPPDLPHRSSIIADLCCERAGCTAFPTTCPPRCQGAYITYYEECGAQLPLDSNPSFESFASACDALVEAVKAKSDGGEPNDDVSVVVVTMRPAME